MFICQHKQQRLPQLTVSTIRWQPMNFPVAVISTCIPTLQAPGAINWSSTTTPLVILKSLFRIPASAHSLTTRWRWWKQGEGMLRLRWAIPAVSLILGPMSMSWKVTATATGTWPMMSNPTRTPSQIQSQTQNPIQSQTQIQNQTLLPIQRRHPFRRNALRLLRQPYSIWQQHYRWYLMLS